MSTKTLELVPLEQLNEEFNLFVDSIEQQEDIDKLGELLLSNTGS